MKTPRARKRPHARATTSRTAREAAPQYRPNICDVGTNIGSTYVAQLRSLRADGGSRARQGVWPSSAPTCGFLRAGPDHADAALLPTSSLSASLVDAPTGRPRELKLSGGDLLAHERTDAGLDVSAQVAPRPIGAILSFAATLNPFVACATYQKIAAATPRAQMIGELRKPEIRAAILAEQAAVHLTGNGGVLTKGYARMFRVTDPVDYEPSAENALQAEAERLGRDVHADVYDTMLENDGQRLIYLPLNNYAYGNLDDVFGMMSGAHALYGISDGGAHCGFICDGSFPTTTLALWSKGSKSGHAIPLETLVHGYTQRNARHVGWHDRGAIKIGQRADVNVIDLDDLSLSPPEIVQDLPAGGTRLLQTAKGYRQTIKSGVVTFEGGRWTGETPGRLLRGEQAA